MVLWWRGALGIGAGGAHPPRPVAADRVAPRHPVPGDGGRDAEAASRTLRRCLAQFRNEGAVAITGQQAIAAPERPAARSSVCAGAPRTTRTA